MTNLKLVEPEATPDPAARSPEHARLREFRATTLTAAAARLAEALATANTADEELRRLEAALADADKRLDVGVPTGDRAAIGEALIDREIAIRKRPAAAALAAAAAADYARASEEFNRSPVIEAKGLLAGALLPEAKRIAAEIDALVYEELAARLRLLGAIKMWLARERIPGVGMDVIDGMRHRHDRFVAAVNAQPPGAAAEAELKALIDALNS